LAKDSDEETDEAEKEDIIIDYPPEDLTEDTDYQLQKAIEILKDGKYAERLAAVQG